MTAPAGIDMRTKEGRAWKEARTKPDPPGYEVPEPMDPSGYTVASLMTEAELAKPRHPFADLTVGRIVHYVITTGECRAAVVSFVNRGKGARVEIQRNDDGEPVYRQAYTLPDSGMCSLRVALHTSFDAEIAPAELIVSGWWGRDGVMYAKAAEWEEDATLGSWHWATEHTT